LTVNASLKDVKITVLMNVSHVPSIILLKMENVFLKANAHQKLMESVNPVQAIIDLEVTIVV
jgi:hypothetical protein